jgi:hypothetical protein
MALRRTRNTALTVLGVAALAAGLFGVLWVVNQGEGFAQCSGLLGYGWSVPLLASLVIGGVVWFLAVQSPRPRGTSQQLDAGACPTCDGVVLPAWRLCPACGTKLPSDGRSTGN